MTNTEATLKGIKELFEEVLDEETSVDKFTDDWADADSAGIAIEIDGISYTVTIRESK